MNVEKLTDCIGDLRRLEYYEDINYSTAEPEIQKLFKAIFKMFPQCQLLCLFPRGRPPRAQLVHSPHILKNIARVRNCPAITID